MPGLRHDWLLLLGCLFGWFTATAFAQEPFSRALRRDANEASADALRGFSIRPVNSSLPREIHPNSWRNVPGLPSSRELIGGHTGQIGQLSDTSPPTPFEAELMQDMPDRVFAGRILPRGDEPVWELLPEGFLYRTYWASAAEPRLATHIVSDNGNGTYLDSHIGGRFGIARKTWANGDAFQFDLLGGAKLRQDWEEELDVIGTDFRYDLLGTWATGRHRYKLGYYHVSSHVGDEFLERNPTFQRLNYYRDAIVFGYAYFLADDLRVYAETGIAFQSEISEPLEFQFGFDYGPRGATGWGGAPFLAANVHLRQEVDFGGDIAIQGGWAWRNGRPSGGILRTGPYFYNGKSPQYSFFDTSEQQIGWGLWYDY